MLQDIADSLGLKEAKGAIVDKAEKDLPAAAAGLKDGDVITAVNGEAVADLHDLARKIAALGPKKDANLTFVRNGATQTVKVQLGSLSDGRQASAYMTEQGGKDALAKLGMTLEPATAVEGAGKTGVVVADVDRRGTRLEGPSPWSSSRSPARRSRVRPRLRRRSIRRSPTARSRC